MNDIAINNIKKELFNFENHILEMENENYLMQEYKEFINDLKEKLLRSKKELTNEVYFLAVIGSIKTGKSTLINLLCSSTEEVSTTQTGRETTKRPVIISSGNNKMIKIFRSRNNHEIDKVGNKIIDYIKGIDDKTNFFHIEEIEFTTPNVEKYLTSNENDLVDGSDIVLIQILISPTENALFNNNVMFIDTPGLDGVISSVGGIRDENEDKENQGDWLLKRIHLAILLQSTVSPLNNEIKGYLEKLHKRIKRTPSAYMLLHNKFSLKNWLVENDIEQNSINARNETKRILEPILKNLKTYEVDLAKAMDGLKKDKKLKDLYTYDLLFEDSEFITFQKEVEKYVTDNKDDDINNNVRNSIINILNEIKFEETIMKDCNDKFDKFEKEYNNVMHLFKWDNEGKTIINHLETEYNSDTQIIDDGWNFNKEIVKASQLTNTSPDVLCEDIRREFRKIIIEDNVDMLVNYLMKRKTKSQKDLKEQINYFEILFQNNKKIEQYIREELNKIIRANAMKIDSQIKKETFTFAGDTHKSELQIKATKFKDSLKKDLTDRLVDIFGEIHSDLYNQKQSKLESKRGKDTNLYKTKQFFEELNKVLNNLKEVAK